MMSTWLYAAVHTLPLELNIISAFLGSTQPSCVSYTNMHYLCDTTNFVFVLDFDDNMLVITYHTVVTNLTRD